MSYSYDQGLYGIGRRTGMSDASGSSAWSYDPRGRLIQETKTIIASGTFVTQHGYNSADGVSWMKYPANNSGGTGEQVTYSYLPQGVLKNVLGAGPYYYLQATTLDAAGRTVTRNLGAMNLTNNPVLKTTLDYFEWSDPNGAGRLQSLASGTPADLTSLQDLRYYNTSNGQSGYDAVGNILRIEDWKAGSPQTQTFSYDNLDRLYTAVASGGTGGTYAQETYTYDTSGRLISKAGLSYDYDDPDHVHAVTGLNDVKKYWFDPIGHYAAGR